VAQRLCMPKLGATMEQALIVEWYRKEGENTLEGEFLVEVLTKKASFKIQSPVTGVVYTILADAGSIVKVGLPLAVLAEEGDEAAALQRAALEAEKALAGQEVSREVYACPIDGPHR